MEFAAEREVALHYTLGDLESASFRASFRQLSAGWLQTLVEGVLIARKLTNSG